MRNPNGFLFVLYLAYLSQKSIDKLKKMCYYGNVLKIVHLQVING